MRPYRGSWRTYETLKGHLEDLRDPKGHLGGPTGSKRGSWRTYRTYVEDQRETLKGLLEDL